MNISNQLVLPCGATLPNRICKAAMTEGLADKFDQPTEALNRLYQTWSEGGAGLLISGNIMVDKRYLERAGNVVIEQGSDINLIKQWTQSATLNGNHFWAQISHPGRQCPRMVNLHPVSPSDVQLDMIGNFGKPTPLLETEIEQIIERFATTARIAKEGGFTGVQIHSAHGYLLSQFLSPITNKRSDIWGGSIENRARLLLAVVRAVRDAVGPAFPIAVKLNSSDFQKGGFSHEDSVKVARWLQEVGIDLLEVSGGTYEKTKFLTTEEEDDVRESTKHREAFFLEYAETMREAVGDLPLMVTGGFRTLEVMNEALEQNKTDMIGLGRPFCLVPDFPNKLLNNQTKSLPKPESKLVLGKGKLSGNSSNSLIRAINTQGQAGYFYYQIYRLAAGKLPKDNLGVFSSFYKHLSRDWYKSIARKLA